MASSGESGTSPLIMGVAAVALVVLLGLPLKQHAPTKSAPGEKPSAASAERQDPSNAATSEAAADGDDFYAPFRRFLGEESFSRRDKMSVADDLELVKILRSYGARYLIATIPDPIDTRAGFHFDVWLEAVQRAAEVQSNTSAKDDSKPGNAYILDQFYMPWTTQASKSKTFQHRSKPGVLLFRSLTPNDEPLKLLVVFLVSDSPTSGVQKESLRRSLRFILTDLREQQFERRESTIIDVLGNVLRKGLLSAGCRDIQPTKVDSDLPKVQILGPAFSGSEPSLQMVIQDLFDHEAKGKTPPSRLERLHFEVLSTATGLRPEEFDTEEIGKKNSMMLRNNARFLNGGELKNGVQWTAELHSTSVADSIVLGALIDHVRGHHKSTPKIAVLYESNTGYGADTDLLMNGEKDQILSAPFPAHINRIYSARKLLTDKQQQELPQIRQREPKLPIPDDIEEGLTELIPLQKSGMTTVVQEFALSRLLTSLRDERVQYMAIRATDPRDKLFLAVLLNEYCPDAQILLTQGDLLYAHPGYYPYLGGALVGSSYPLAPEARAWGIADTPHTSIVFADAFGQAYYNAVLLLLGKPDLVVDYDTPLAFAENATTGPRAPGVWISQVGRQRLRPEAFYPLPKAEAAARDQFASSKLLPGNYTKMAPAAPQSRPESIRPPASLFWPWYVVLCFYIVVAVMVAGMVYRSRAVPVGPAEPNDRSSRVGDALDIIHFALSDPMSPLPSLTLALFGLTWLFIGVWFLWAQLLLINLASDMGTDVFRVVIVVIAGAIAAAILACGYISVQALTVSRKSLPEALTRGLRSPAGWIALALLILVCLGMVGAFLSDNTQLGLTPGQKRIMAWQLTDFSSGLCPLAPPCLLALAMLLGGYLTLKCRWLSQGLTPLPSHTVPAIYSDVHHWFQLVRKKSDEGADALWQFGRPLDRPLGSKPWRDRWRVHFILLPMACLWFVPEDLWALWQPFGNYYLNSVFVFLALVALSLMTLWQAADFIAFWKLCEAHHNDLGNLPLQKAWHRLPAGLVRDYLSPVFQLRVRKTAPKYAQQQFLRLHELMPSEPQPSWGLTRDEFTKLATLEAPPTTPHLVTTVGLFTSARILSLYLARSAWQQLSAGEAFEIEDARTTAPSPPERHADDALHAAAEDYVAIAIALFLSRCQKLLKHRAMLLLVVPLLMLAAVTSYPVQPSLRVLFVVGAMMLVSIASLVYVLTGMNRDPLLSHATKTQPGLFTLDSHFLIPMLVFVGPLVIFLISQLPVVGPYLQELTSPIVEMLGRLNG